MTSGPWRAEEGRLQLLIALESSLNEIYMFDETSLKFSYANLGALRNLGYSIEAMRELTLLDLKPDFDETGFRGLLEPLLSARSESIRFETRHRRRDGSLYPVDMHLQLVPSGERRIFLAMVLDITEHRRVESELRAGAARLRELAQRLAQTEEDERRRINRELHDRVGQSLAALALNLSLVRARLPADAPTTLTDSFDNSQRLLVETTLQVRNVMADLHPPALDEYGLWSALRAFAKSFEGQTGIKFEMTGGDLEPRLARAAELALLRIAQGAMANIGKHSGARRAGIQLIDEDVQIRLVIEDEGLGFDPSVDTTSRGSWGLSIMRERAESIGASLQIKSSPGAGCRVEIELRR